VLLPAVTVQTVQSGYVGWVAMSVYIGDHDAFGSFDEQLWSPRLNILFIEREQLGRPVAVAPIIMLDFR
jgi:hypothetical protein